MQRWEEELMWKKEGHDLGVAEGKNIGLEEGKNIGLAEGRRAERLETAAKMKANGMPLEDISKYTNLTLEEIEKIKELND